MTLDFAESRAGQRIGRDRVVGDTLVTRQALRSRFDCLANRVLCFVPATCLFRHNEGDEFAFFFEHADLANRGLLGISLFEILGLNFFSTLGFDQC